MPQVPIKSKTLVFNTLGQTSTTIPAGCQTVEIAVKGSAGGGGSGRRGLSSSLRTGGDGGGAGGYSVFEKPASYFGGGGALLPIYIGDGGVGGAAVTVDSTNGNNGRPGHSAGVGCVVDYAEVGDAGHVFNSIAWNGTIAVIAGSSGTILSSTDFVNWTARTSNTATTINALIWVGGTINLFVGTAGTSVVTSPDGITWTVTATGSSAGLTDLCYDSSLGLIVAVGTSGNVVTSTAPATTWTSGISYGGSGNFPVIANDNNAHFVIVDGGGTVAFATSPGATGNWTHNSGDAAGYFAVTYVSGVTNPWVALSQQGRVSSMSAYNGTLTNNGQTAQGLVTCAPGDNVLYSYGTYSLDGGVTWYGQVSRFGVAGIRDVLLLNGTYYATNIVGAPSVCQLLMWSASSVVKWDGLGVATFTPIGGAQGNGGLGGNATANGTATAGNSAMVSGGAGSAHNGAANATQASSGAGGGGGAGGSATAANALENPSTGGDGGIALGGPRVPNVSGFPTQVGTWPQATSCLGVLSPVMGAGGNGGVGALAATGMAGGQGGDPGGAGAGGSFADNTFASGAGGKGGKSEVQVTFKF